MILTWELAVAGQGVLLVPYRAAYVQQYHSWMEDTDLREATASERLTLAEEYDMQQEWRDDSRSRCPIRYALLRRPSICVKW